MKKNIHPDYNIDAKMTCASCDAVFDSGSVRESLAIETCSNCHPFYTGKQKIVDSTGRVDRFKKLSERASQTKDVRSTLRTKAEKEAIREQKRQEKKKQAQEKKAD